MPGVYVGEKAVPARWVYVSVAAARPTVFLAPNVTAGSFSFPAYQPVWLCRHGNGC